MAQENVELVRRTMVEVANRRDVDTLDDLASADYEWHNARDLPGGGVHRGREAVKAQLRDYLPCVMGKFARTMASSTTLKPSKRWDWGSRRGVAPLVTRQPSTPRRGGGDSAARRGRYFGIKVVPKGSLVRTRNCAALSEQ